ncbi:MAG TPA: hypothetical protein VMW70_10820 [Burkholderiales bacterium]|jgi:uncharacterized membrane protein YkoI|nr:hypothetical protein [Burkholderiales bacterium]
MMLRRILPALGLLLIMTQLSSHDANARYPSQGNGSGGQTIKVADRAVSMRDAINRVRQQTPGRILDAQDQGDHYRVKVLTPDGVVRIYRVDASTGAVR